MLRIITSALAFLMLTGCGAGTTTRYVIGEVSNKRIHCGEWNQNRYIINTQFGEMIVLESEYHRIVPGVPISICETVDANGNVIRRELARRID